MHFRQAYDPFRALSSSWELVKRAPLALILGGFLFLIVESSSGVGWQVEVDSAGRDLRSVLGEVADELRRNAGAVVVGNVCLAIPLWLFGCWVRLGFARAVRRTLAGEVATAGDLFSESASWGSMVLTSLLRFALIVLAVLPIVLILLAVALVAAAADLDRGVLVVASIAGAVLYLPVLVYVLLGLWLAPMAVAFEQMRPGEAIARSWELAKGRRWSLLLYWFVFEVAEFVGLIACCCCLVGYLLPWGILCTGRYESYAQLVGVAPSPPPPPPAE